MNKKKLRKLQKSAQSKNRPSRKVKQVDYQVLEPRQMLATDIGLQFSGVTQGTETNSLLSNVQGDIGYEHYVEVANGAFVIHDRDTGTRVRTMTLDDFFLQAGAFVPTETSDPQILFDHRSERWFAAANGDGEGNYLYIAVSDTSDPTGVWESSQFIGDSTGVHFNQDISLAVDADAVYLATNNTSRFGNDTSLYSIPKSDLFLDDPTITNMSRFEGLTTYGSSLQVATNFEDSDGKATVIGSGAFGVVFLADLTDTSGAGATLSDPDALYVGVNVVDDDGAPVPLDFPIQEAAPSSTDPAGRDLIINRDVTGSIYEWEGSIWGAMTVTTDFDMTLGPEVPDDSGDFQQGVLWFEIDVNEKEIVTQDRGPNAHVIFANNTDTIRQTYFNPSIAVDKYGVLSIQFNSATLDLEADEDDPVGNGAFIGSVNVVGTVTNGINKRAVHYDDPLDLQVGIEDYEPVAEEVPWGKSTAVRVDPLETSTFWTVASFANTGDRWTSDIAKIQPIELAPYIEADANDNFIVIKPMLGNPALMEVVMDDFTTDILPFEVLGAVSIMGHAGADHFLMDYTLGDPITPGGLVLDGGFGTDTVESNNPLGAEFIIDKYDHETYGDTYPERLRFFIDPPPGGVGDRLFPVMDDFTLTAPDGFYNEISEVVDIEELWGGPGDDRFRFEEGHMLGSALGFGGDDRFEFAGAVIGDVTDDMVADWTGSIGESIDGGMGFNTLDFTDLQQDAGVRVLGASEFNGFDGNTVFGLPTSFHGVDGPIGGNNPTDQWRNISFLRGSEFGGDRLFGMNAETVVTIDDEASTYRADGGQMGFWHWENIFASEFDDKFHVVSNTLDPIRLNGLAGDDTYRFSSDSPGSMGTTDNIGGLVFALAGEGDNTMVVSNFGGVETEVLVLAERISGMGEIVYSAVDGTFALIIFTSRFDDLINLHSFDKDNTLIVRSYFGDDVFDIQDLSKASVKIYGGEGDDLYVIERVQDVDFRNLEIFDSPNGERDRVTLAGTVLNETWVIDNQTFADLDVAYEGIEIFGVEGRGGDDIFDIRESTFELFIDGGGGNDIFNVSSDAPFDEGTLAGIEQELHIEAGTGTNALNISNRAGAGTAAEIGIDTIVGLFPMPMFYQATGGDFAAINTQFAGVRITGSELGNDTFNVNEFLAQNDLLINALGGNDRIKVVAGVEADIDIDGGEDGDIYQVYFVGEGNRQLSITDFGAAGSDRMEFYGTDDPETITVNNFAVERFDETVITNGEFAFLSVDTFAGNDVLTLAHSLARTNYFRAGSGDDFVSATGTDNVRGFRAFLGSGLDEISLSDVNVDTNTFVHGGSDSDIIRVRPAALGNVNADGEDGGDTYHVDLVGTGNRYVDTRDSGATGIDTTSVRATANHDELEVRRTRVFEGDERIAYDDSVERLDVDTEDGNDQLNLFYSAADETYLKTGSGLDSVYIRSTGPTNLLDINVGAGNDTVTLRSTKAATDTTINGAAGDDQFHVGTGLLGRLRGPISIVGGANSFAGEDEIHVDDSLTNGPLNYEIDSTDIRWTSGPVNSSGSPLFAGVTFDATVEFARINGTAKKNNFVVTPSQNTRFYIFGDAPVAGEPTVDSINLLMGGPKGAQLHITDAAFGEGFWDFTDGSENVEFEGIEATFD